MLVGATKLSSEGQCVTLNPGQAGFQGDLLFVLSNVNQLLVKSTETNQLSLL